MKHRPISANGQLQGRTETTGEQVRMHAFETFGEEAKALHWLNRPNQLLGGKKPVDLLQTQPAEVERELVRIDHGIFV